MGSYLQPSGGLGVPYLASDQQLSNLVNTLIEKQLSTYIPPQGIQNQVPLAESSPRSRVKRRPEEEVDQYCYDMK